MLADFRIRSNDPELMDNFLGDATALQRVLDDINNVNRILGGNSITVNMVARLIEQNPQETYTIIDVGCADGTMLRAIADHCRTEDIKTELIGIDLNTDALALAKKESFDYPEIRFLEQDVLRLETFDLNCDILTTTLMTHHFTDSQLDVLLPQFVRLANIGVIINDLHRSCIAFFLFKLFSLFFIRTETAKIDGLISIRKGFKKKDLEHLSTRLPQMYHYIKWKWAFRYVWMMEPKRPSTI